MTDTVFDGETPPALIPQSGETPVSTSTYYKQLFITENATSADAAADPLVAPIDPFASDANQPSELPAVGVLLTLEQAWRQQGLALGELRHSLCLAPGEVTKVAVVDWRRDTLDRTEGSTTQDEQVASVSDGSQAMQTVQNAVASEVQNGKAETSSDSAHVQAAASGGGILFSASGSGAMAHQRGMSASWSQGSRSLASDARTNVHRRTMEMSGATRSRRATQIREVSERERQETTTRVVANYNHMHALTIQYYEVLQVYELDTKVIRAERCVFVPMEPVEFTADNLGGKPDVVESLRRVLVDFRAYELVAMLDQFEQDDDQIDRELGELREKTPFLESDLKEQQRGLDDAVDDALDNWGDAEVGVPAASAVQTFNARVVDLGDLEQIERRIEQLLPSGVSMAQLRVVVDRMEESENDRYPRLIQQVIDADQALQEHLRRITLRKAARVSQPRLWPTLQDHQLFLNQQMWMRIDEHRWQRMLTGRTYPSGDFAGQDLGGLVNPKPLGYFGNFVSFSWDFPRGSDEERKNFERDYVSASSQRNKDRDQLHERVVLPTEGVFAEAVLGQANSAEKLDISRFWNWQDSPIPILPPEMSPVATGSRARDTNAGQLDFAAAVATIRGKFDSLDSTADSELVAALTQQLFDNRTGMDAASAGAIAAGNNTAAGANAAQQTTVDLQKNTQDFVVGLANSEVGKIAASAVAAKTGGISSVGGLVNAAKSASNAASTAKPAASNDDVVDLSEKAVPAP